jgi:general secretion pathway protein A
MYLEFYGFREKPFNLTPDPRFVFLSKTHREAFAHLLYGINNRAGFIALTGEVGAGKTTVLRALLSQLDAEHYRTALIFNPGLSPSELLQSINREFGIPASPGGGANLLDALNPFLLQQNAEGRTVVLVVDEAQRLETSVLEQIRLISNLETDREKLIQIVLAGQPELGQMLKRKDLRQLSQRITVRYHLHPLDLEDTREYIHHRLEVAGGKGAVAFSGMAVRRIYRYSRGLPRLINAACDRALLAGYTKEASKITYRMAGAAIRDVKKEVPSIARRLAMIPALVVILLIIVGAGFYIKGQSGVNEIPSSPPVEALEKDTDRKAEISGEEASRALMAEIGRPTEVESARRAFNVLSGFWKAPPLPEKELADIKDMERFALERKLRVYRFSGNLGALLRINSPAILELTLPGVQGKRFICLMGKADEDLLIEPVNDQKKSMAPGDLERHWSGQALIFWKDEMNLLTKVSAGARGQQIKHLQELLKEAGTYNQPVTGIYDKQTASAVKAFQLSRGIEQDGIAGGQTLMLLYRSIDRFSVPGLQKEAS